MIPRYFTWFVLSFQMLVAFDVGLDAIGRAKAADLERGSTEQRLRALVEILDIPVSQREAGTWKAMYREATRMWMYYRSEKHVSDEERELNSAYAAGLVRGLGESREPTVIPLLVKYAGFGRYATDALAGFGDLAVPEMLRVSEGRANVLNQKGGVSIVLADMLRTRTSDGVAPLTEASRRRIEGLAQQLLRTDAKMEIDEILNLARVALVTGRSDLRTEIERLATDPTAWRNHGVVDSFAIEYGQRSLQTQLKSTSTP